jgi:hypothetical protein
MVNKKDMAADRRQALGGYATADMQAGRDYAAPKVPKETRDAIRADGKANGNLHRGGGCQGE